MARHFDKTVRKFIDDWTSSSIAARVSKYRGEVEVEVSLSDCSKKILWHDFGRNKKEALKKCDAIIQTFQKIRDTIEAGYAHVDDK